MDQTQITLEQVKENNRRLKVDPFNEGKYLSEPEGKFINDINYSLNLLKDITELAEWLKEDNKTDNIPVLKNDLENITKLLENLKFSLKREVNKN